MTQGDTAALVEKGQRYYLPVYKPRHVILARGEGSRVWDIEGRDYVDLSAGIAVCGLGHCDPDLVAAAIAEPGHVLRRPSKVTPLVPKRRPAVKPATPTPSKAAPSKPRGPTPAQLRRIADLEAELEAAAERHAAELARIAVEKRALELRRDESESNFLKRRTELREALRKARLVLR